MLWYPGGFYNVSSSCQMLIFMPLSAASSFFRGTKKSYGGSLYHCIYLFCSSQMYVSQKIQRLHNVSLSSNTTQCLLAFFPTVATFLHVMSPQCLSPIFLSQGPIGKASLALLAKQFGNHFDYFNIVHLGIQNVTVDNPSTGFCMLGVNDN